MVTVTASMPITALAKVLTNIFKSLAHLETPVKYRKIKTKDKREKTKVEKDLQGERFKG